MTQTDVQFTSNERPAAGAWRLPPGQALTLRPAHGGLVRVRAGGLWATFDGPHAGPVSGRGDHLLGAGELIALRPGERVVVEPASRTSGASIEWEPADAGLGMPDGVRTVRGAPADALGSPVAAAAVRLLLAVVAVGLTAGLWLGAASESARHRDDARVLAGQAPRAGKAADRPAAPSATARAAGPRARPPA